MRCQITSVSIDLSKRLGSSVGMSVRLKIVRSTVRSRPQPHILDRLFTKAEHISYIVPSFLEPVYTRRPLLK